MDLKDFKYSVEYSKLAVRRDDDRVFDLYSPQGRKLYFNSRVGEEITALREYLKQNTFIGYMLSAKMAGKGTYTNQLKESIGEGLFENISVGDLVRAAEKDYLLKKEASEVYIYTKKNYRGLMSLDDIFYNLTHRTTANLSVPTDFVLLVLKREIDRIGRKSIFIDGFPRSIDQVSYSLYMRDLVNYRNDPDCFILINLPLEVINERILERRTCPVCRNSRNIKLNPTSLPFLKAGNVELYCDNPSCIEQKIEMERKEGDEKGISLIKNRIESELDVMDLARKMYGIEKVELYNAVEIEVADKYSMPFERHGVFTYSIDGNNVIPVKKEYTFKENGKEYVSFLPPYVVCQMIRELVRTLGVK